MGHELHQFGCNRVLPCDGRRGRIPAAILLVTIPWVAFQLWSKRVGYGGAARYGTLLILTAILCNVPWILRNYHLWHVTVLRTNFGMTIYSSNNDCAQSSLAKNMQSGCYSSTHPVGSDRETALMNELGEVAYDRRRTADTLNWIRKHPDRFRELTLTRMVEFWFPDAPGEAAYGFALGTLLSIPGIILMAKRREPVTLYVLFVWLVYPLVYYIVVTCDRYRYPILWTSLLPAGYCIVSVRYGLMHARASSGGRHRAAPRPPSAFPGPMV
jgi:hypothetical protein